MPCLTQPPSKIAVENFDELLSAYDELPSKGGQIGISNVEILFEDTFTVNKPVYFKGEGQPKPSTRFKLKSGVNKPMINITTYGVGSIFEDIEFYAEDNKVSEQYGVQISTGDISFHRCGFTRFGRAVYITGNHMHRFLGCVIARNTYGIYTEGSILDVSHCWLFNNVQNVYCKNSYYDTIAHNVMYQNMTISGGSFIYLLGGSHHIVDGNTMYLDEGTMFRAIQINASYTRTINNLLEGRTGTPIATGIYGGINDDYNIYIGNILVNCTTPWGGTYGANTIRANNIPQPT
ncbi:MAG: hypothetical protein JRE40_01695 [Deltaproteobacteria bacterium]|nr:hypothetical protein [Deltaproteobacteria bacterium]MBW2672516.1 hypothetical protein [Deltaproteobacteria bacterium]